jgi:glucose/arabinose dehydrogenase
LQFYTGRAFPERYRGGLFVALHGSLFREPLARTGYRVAFIPFENGAPKGPVEPFASGRRRLGGSLGAALIRPSGLAVDSSGALYISDDTGERIWRVTWQGDTR